MACPERQSYITANVTVRTVILQTLSLKELSSACQNVQTSAVNLEKKLGWCLLTPEVIVLRIMHCITSAGEKLWFTSPGLIPTNLLWNSWFHFRMTMLTILLTVDYILKDPTERERLNVHQTPRVYPQWLVMSSHWLAVMIHAHWSADV